jgi:hypothetical protein
VRGAHALEAYVAETTAWLRERDVEIEHGEHVTVGRHGFEEAVLHLDGDGGRVEVPVAVVADRAADGRIDELRIYYSRWALTGRHATRPPVLQPGAELRLPGAVAEHQRALAAGDLAAVVGSFEPDAVVRDATGAHGVRPFHERALANGSGIALEPCALIDDGRICALEYNVVRPELPLEAGVVVYALGPSGRLAAARIYDDVDRGRE